MTDKLEAAPTETIPLTEAEALELTMLGLKQENARLRFEAFRHVLEREAMALDTERGLLEDRIITRASDNGACHVVSVDVTTKTVQRVRKGQNAPGGTEEAPAQEPVESAEEGPAQEPTEPDTVVRGL